MRKNIKCFLIFLLIFTSINSYAQIFYYSEGKKISLQRDTTKLFVNINRTKVGQSFLINLLKTESVQSVDNTSDSNVMAIKLSTYSSKSKILSILKKENNILHAWDAVNLDGLIFIPTGEILLKTKDGITVDDILNKLNLKNQVSVSNGNYYNMSVLNVIDSSNLFNIANLIYESKLVDWCHPNFYVPITNYTNDPLYAQQYYLRNTGQFGGVAGIDINIEGAWNITKGSANIRIAVIDEGVEAHEDLGTRVLNGFTPRDVNGNGRPTPTGAHGEATAGIIAATQDNAIGISGIAPLCQIVPINIFAGGETALDIANGINWAWNQGQADVLSNSWGYNTSSQTQPNFDAVIQAINNARTQGRAGRGSIVVFAAGNNFGNGVDDVSFPANVDGVITVGACNNTPPSGAIWYYSERGPSMDLVAPSGDINLLGDVVTLDRMGALGYEAGNYTTRFGGTSAACPQVSGIAALMLSANPNLTEAQVRSILQTTATDMGTPGFDNTFGFGRANGCAAVNSALATILNISGDNIFCTTTSNNYTIPNLPNGATVQWKATPAGIATPNTPYLTQTTLTATGNGIISLTATITSSCSDLVIVSKSNIAVGKPQPGPIAFPLIDPALGKIQAQVDPVPGATSYNWYKNGVLQTIGHGSFIQFPITRNLCNVYYDISVEAINICGTSLRTHGEAYVPPCNNAFAISPNPASASINVATAAGNAQLSASTTIDEIRIYDLQGNLKKYQKFNKATSATMNIQGLINGTYFVEIISGTIKERHQLVIQN